MMARSWMTGSSPGYRCARVLAIASLAGAVGLGGCSAAATPPDSTSTIVGSTPTSLDTFPSASAVPVASAWASLFTWQRVAYPADLDPGARIQAALGGFVLSSGSAESAWYSPNGTSWQRLEGAPKYATVWSDGTAHGAVAFGCTSLPYGICSMRHTVDGRSWQPTVGLDMHNYSIADVAVNGGRILAIGSITGPAAADGTGVTLLAHAVGENVVIGSPDGVHWSRLPGPPGSAGASFSWIRPLGKGFVIFGARDDGTTYMWASPDGATWSDGMLFPDAVKVGLVSCVSAATGLVVAGQTYVPLPSGWDPWSLAPPPPQPPGPVVIWTSPDGQHWTKHTGLPAFQGAAVGSLGIAGSSIVAVGQATDSESGQFTGIWVSTDGVDWKQTLGPGDRYEEPGGVATDGSRLVIVTTVFKPDRTFVREQIWVGTPIA